LEVDSTCACSQDEVLSAWGCTIDRSNDVDIPPARTPCVEDDAVSEGCN
jgi:hypothetical protein